MVTGAGGTLQIAPGEVRRPDGSFIPWDRFPGRRIPDEPAPHLCPVLLVDVVTPGDLPAEVDRKLREYVAHGTELAWVVDPVARTIEVLTGPDRSAAVRLAFGDTLTGVPVLPDFAVPVADLFADLEPV